ncbi:MAG: 5-dehydro-2-deoxygluconokinase [Actinobacteria bacterium]|nr:5-dehydro-2-deoxygluconokinase [Actinomycetota bacterium]
MSEPLDLITVGRVSVDLYAEQLNASFAQPQTFKKSIGGSPTNVAVAAAKLGHKSAVITKVGGDPLGGYVVEKLKELGVDTSLVGTDQTGMTPVVLAALDPPEDPQIIFYRGPSAPDTTLVATDLTAAQLAATKILWISACALAAGSTATAAFDWLRARNRNAEVILDLDYRPSFWKDQATAGEAARSAIALATVVVGNKIECETAIGISDPQAAADELLNLGVRLAIVKMGGEGVLLATKDSRVIVPPLKIDVVCGLGAGDAFGGALVHGLLTQLSLSEIGAFANAAGAYVAAKLMCADAMPDLTQLTSFLETTKDK